MGVLWCSLARSSSSLRQRHLRRVGWRLLSGIRPWLGRLRKQSNRQGENMCQHGQNSSRLYAYN